MEDCIEEPTMYFYGEGLGAESLVGNDGKVAEETKSNNTKPKKESDKKIVESENSVKESVSAEEEDDLLDRITKALESDEETKIKLNETKNVTPDRPFSNVKESSLKTTSLNEEQANSNHKSNDTVVPTTTKANIDNDNKESILPAQENVNINLKDDTDESMSNKKNEELNKEEKEMANMEECKIKDNTQITSQDHATNESESMSKVKISDANDDVLNLKNESPTTSIKHDNSTEISIPKHETPANIQKIEDNIKNILETSQQIIAKFPSIDNSAMDATIESSTSDTLTNDEVMPVETEELDSKLVEDVEEDTPNSTNGQECPSAETEMHEDTKIAENVTVNEDSSVIETPLKDDETSEITEEAIISESSTKQEIQLEEVEEEENSNKTPEEVLPSESVTNQETPLEVEEMQIDIKAPEEENVIESSSNQEISLKTIEEPESTVEVHDEVTNEENLTIDESLTNEENLTIEIKQESTSNEIEEVESIVKTPEVTINEEPLKEQDDEKCVEIPEEMTIDESSSQLETPLKEIENEVSTIKTPEEEADNESSSNQEIPSENIEDEDEDFPTTSVKEPSTIVEVPEVPETMNNGIQEQSEFKTMSEPENSFNDKDAADSSEMSNMESENIESSEVSQHVIETNMDLSESLTTKVNEENSIAHETIESSENSECYNDGPETSEAKHEMKTDSTESITTNENEEETTNVQASFTNETVEAAESQNATYETTQQKEFQNPPETYRMFETLKEANPKTERMRIPIPLCTPKSSKIVQAPNYTQNVVDSMHQQHREAEELSKAQELNESNDNCNQMEHQSDHTLVLNESNDNCNQMEHQTEPTNELIERKEVEQIVIPEVMTENNNQVLNKVECAEQSIEENVTVEQKNIEEQSNNNEEPECSVNVPTLVIDDKLHEETTEDKKEEDLLETRESNEVNKRSLNLEIMEEVPDKEESNLVKAVTVSEEPQEDLVVLESTRESSSVSAEQVESMKEESLVVPDKPVVDEIKPTEEKIVHISDELDEISSDDDREESFEETNLTPEPIAPKVAQEIKVIEPSLPIEIATSTSVTFIPEPEKEILKQVVVEQQNEMLDLSKTSREVLNEKIIESSVEVSPTKVETPKPMETTEIAEDLTKPAEPSKSLPAPSRVTQNLSPKKRMTLLPISNRKRKISETRLPTESDSDSLSDRPSDSVSQDTEDDEEAVSKKKLKLRTKNPKKIVRKNAPTEINESINDKQEEKLIVVPKIDDVKPLVEPKIVQAPIVSKKRGRKSKRGRYARKSNQNDGSSSDEDAPSSAKGAKKEGIASKTTTPKKKRETGPKGLLRHIDTSLVIDTNDETPVRMSRRIAQQKIREETDRRQMEEKLLKQMKAEAEKKKKGGPESDNEKDKNYEKEEEEEEEEGEEENSDEAGAKEGKKRKKTKILPSDKQWQTSSSASEESEQEEEDYMEHIPSDHGSPLFRSDHEFSPESDDETDQVVVPIKRARTAKKVVATEASSDYEDVNPIHACQVCHKTDSPEWILLCDQCDHGYHCSCLTPIVFLIPSGNWFCPLCCHKNLVEKLSKQLIDYDSMMHAFKLEEIRKQRQTLAEISAENIIEESQEAHRKRERSDKYSEDRETSVKKKTSRAISYSSNESSGSSSDDEPLNCYKLRKRNQAAVPSYRFNDYDDLINSAIRKDMASKVDEDIEIDEGEEDDDETHAGNAGRGKDIATIIEADKEEKKQLDDETIKDDIGESKGKKMETRDESSDDSDIVKPRKYKGKKKSRKLNNLDISSEEDRGSDEDFKGASSSDSDEAGTGSGDSESSLDFPRRKGKKGKSTRRSTRTRQKRVEERFIDDNSSDDEPLKPPARKIKKRTLSEEEEFDVNDDDDEDGSVDEEIDSEDLCDDTETSDSSNNGWPKKKKKRTASYDIKPVKKVVKRTDDEDKAFRAGISKKKILKESLKSDAEDDKEGSDGSESAKGKRKTRGKKLLYLIEDDLESSDDGIKPGVKRPDTPPEERELFIKKQEEIKRMLAAKNTEGAKQLAAPKIGRPQSPPPLISGESSSLSTVPKQFIESAKALDLDYRIKPQSSMVGASKMDMNPNDMNEEELARMMEEEDFAQHQLKLAGEAIARKKLLDLETKVEENFAGFKDSNRKDKPEPKKRSKKQKVEVKPIPGSAPTSVIATLISATTAIPPIMISPSKSSILTPHPSQQPPLQLLTTQTENLSRPNPPPLHSHPHALGGPPPSTVSSAHHGPTTMPSQIFGANPLFAGIVPRHPSVISSHYPPTPEQLLPLSYHQPPSVHHPSQAHQLQQISPESDSKKRGRRKKFTPLRTDLPAGAATPPFGMPPQFSYYAPQPPAAHRRQSPHATQLPPSAIQPPTLHSIQHEQATPPSSNVTSHLPPIGHPHPQQHPANPNQEPGESSEFGGLVSYFSSQQELD
ncbi:unnamed protein product [Diamesa hyperborea]